MQFYRLLKQAENNDYVGFSLRSMQFYRLLKLCFLSLLFSLSLMSMQITSNVTKMQDLIGVEEQLANVVATLSDLVHK